MSNSLIINAEIFKNITLLQLTDYQVITNVIIKL
jgi:hypothetical protein